MASMTGGSCTMGVICTYDTCIRDRRLLLVIFMVISGFPWLPVARDCTWLPVHWFFIWLSCLSVATAVVYNESIMQPAMRMQITLSNTQTLFRCESWKMKEVCHSTLLLVCHLMHFQKDPEDSIC